MKQCFSRSQKSRNQVDGGEVIQGPPTHTSFRLYRTNGNGFMARGRENVFPVRDVSVAIGWKSYKALLHKENVKWRFQCDFDMIGWFLFHTR